MKSKEIVAIDWAATDFCKGHKPQGNKLSYIGFFNWCEEQEKKGRKQLQCPACGRWLFPSEWGSVKPNPHLESKKQKV